MTALAGRSSRPTQRCIEPTRQLSDPASTRRCRRIAPEDVHDCRVREVHPTVDLIGAPAPGGTLDRSCGMGCRPKDVLDLRGVRDWMEKGGSRGRHRCPGGMAGGNTPSISRASCAARSAAQAQSRIDLLRAAPCPKVSAARTAARGRWSPRCSSSKIGNTGHAQAAAKRAIARISSIPSGMVTGASGTAQPLRSRALSGRGNGTRVLRRSSSLVSVGDHTDRPPGHRIERRLGQSAAVS